MPTVSFDVTIQQATRIADVIGKVQHLLDASGNPRTATLSEVRAWIVSQLRSLVLNYERQEQLAQAVIETPLNIL